ncbi:MAG: hypothetical protein ACO3PD_03390 [Acidimicrobiales bacterium]
MSDRPAPSETGAALARTVVPDTAHDDLVGDGRGPGVRALVREGIR